MARILVIDDDEMVRSTMRMILESSGHEVVEAPDGVHGMELFQAREFDLVITDLYMPVKEGIETIQDVVLSDRPVPVLAVSGGGVGRSGSLIDAELLGASATLSKPFSVVELRGAVDALLEPRVSR